MMQKSTWIAIAAVVLGVGAAAVVFFVFPRHHPSTPTRLFGYVDHGSIERRGSETKFVVSDGPNHTTVIHDGPLPDTFRDGAQVMVEGRVAGDHFVAQKVSAKCPDTYNTKDGPRPAATFR